MQLRGKKHTSVTCECIAREDIQLLVVIICMEKPFHSESSANIKIYETHVVMAKNKFFFLDLLSSEVQFISVVALVLEADFFMHIIEP